MKIEKINDNKIKITLDTNDLAKRHIDAKSFVTNAPESQDLFWDVMREAEKIGFSIDESMVYVEAHINNTGLFTLIVTKTQNTPAAPIKAKEKKPGYTLKRKAQNPEVCFNLYRFANIIDLLDFCKLTNKSASDDSSLYSYNDNYYLKINNNTSMEAPEFAFKDNNPIFTMSKIYEYGHIIYEGNAINTIKKL